MKNETKALLETHIAVALFGFASLFPKLLDLNSLTIVLGRVFFASISLWFFLIIKKKQKVKIRNKILLFFSGFILSIHWVTFFHSIKISSVSIGVLSFSTFPLFLSFLEPIFFKEQLKLSSLIYSILALTGIFIITDEISFDNMVFQGIIFGLISALTYAFLLLANRYLLRRNSLLPIVFFQNLSAFILLLFIFLKNPEPVNFQQIFLLLILGILGTTLAHTLFTKGLKYLSAHTAGIINCLEFIYAIGLEILVFQTIPSIRVLIGGIILLVISFKVSLSKN